MGPFQTFQSFHRFASFKSLDAIMLFQQFNVQVSTTEAEFEFGFSPNCRESAMTSRPSDDRSDLTGSGQPARQFRSKDP
jgi:hypothetical protein